MTEQGLGHEAIHTPEDDSTGLDALTDDELRTHVRIMLEGHGHRGPREWPLDDLEDDVYQEIERRSSALAELRTRQDQLLQADLRRRMREDPTTPDVDAYVDSGLPWADRDAEREYDEVREEWRRLMTAWVNGTV
ncbi:hypothetical protein ABZ832_09905 [Streptantibioticus parmotrematis]|uniref:hypothetical protein n=1 Tax=Streptantibioticus parmotrematis TaxID=2873249 RepID=UPI0033EA84E7